MQNISFANPYIYPPFCTGKNHHRESGFTWNLVVSRMCANNNAFSLYQVSHSFDDSFFFSSLLRRVNFVRSLTTQQFWPVRVQQIVCTMYDRTDVWFSSCLFPSLTTRMIMLKFFTALHESCYQVNKSTLENFCAQPPKRFNFKSSFLPAPHINMRL